MFPDLSARRHKSTLYARRTVTYGNIKISLQIIRKWPIEMLEGVYLYILVTLALVLEFENALKGWKIQLTVGNPHQQALPRFSGPCAKISRATGGTHISILFKLIQ